MKLIARTGVLLALPLALAAGIWAQTVPPDCKILYDAEDKLLITPHHGFNKRTADSTKAKVDVSESIFANGAFYVLARGEWRKSSLTIDEMRQQAIENRKNARNISCKFLRDETVDGAAARVFQAHFETEDAKSDATLWISKSTGLPLKQEQDTDLGGAAGKTHMSIRYEYSNVSAPAVH
jgi:hypothetical protein